MRLTHTPELVLLFAIRCIKCTPSRRHGVTDPWPLPCGFGTSRRRRRTHLIHGPASQLLSSNSGPLQAKKHASERLEVLAGAQGLGKASEDTGRSMEEEVEQLLSEHRQRTNELREAMEVGITRPRREQLSSRCGDVSVKLPSSIVAIDDLLQSDPGHTRSAREACNRFHVGQTHYPGCAPAT